MRLCYRDEKDFFDILRITAFKLTIYQLKQYHINRILYLLIVLNFCVKSQEGIYLKKFHKNSICSTFVVPHIKLYTDKI